MSKPKSFDTWTPEKQEEWRTNVREANYKCARRYREANPERARASSAKHYKANRDKIKEIISEKRATEPEKYREASRKYYQNNIDKERERLRRYRQSNPDKVREQQRKYAEANTDKKRERERNRYSSDPFYALKIRQRSRIKNAFRRKRFKKGTFTEKMIGCSWEFFYNYIEHQFTKGMTWDNRSEWHIDHIIPLSSARSADEAIKLCHFSNLRPLWAEQNLEKGCRIVTCQPELTIHYH